MHTKTDAAYSKALDFLKSAHTDIGWPYSAGQIPAVEPTVWCAIALRQSSEIRDFLPGYLRSMQNADGGWSSRRGAGRSDWSSGLAVMALRILLDTQSASNAETVNQAKLEPPLSKGVTYLETHRMEMLKDLWTKVLYALMYAPEALNYPRGWTWTEGCFNWVEPTSYSLIGLKGLKIARSQPLNSYIASAEQFLINHSIKSGGWNHGDNHPLGVWAAPYPVTTAQALVAMQNLQNHPTVIKALDYLKDESTRDDTVMSLAWSILALNCYGFDTKYLQRKLFARQNDDGSFGNDFFLGGLATTALGIDKYGNPLKLAG